MGATRRKKNIMDIKVFKDISGKIVLRKTFEYSFVYLIMSSKDQAPNFLWHELTISRK